MSPVVNDYLHNYLSYVAGVNDASVKEADKHEGSRTELDTHANMPVLGIHCYVIAQVGERLQRCSHIDLIMSQWIYPWSMLRYNMIVPTMGKHTY